MDLTGTGSGNRIIMRNNNESVALIVKTLKNSKNLLFRCFVKSTRWFISQKYLESKNYLAVIITFLRIKENGLITIFFKSFFACSWLFKKGMQLYSWANPK